jgi:nicotinate phosphoribosyltransferase
MLEIEKKKQGLQSRLTNATFQFSPLLGQGLYSAQYFIKSQTIVKNWLPHQTVTMQFFQRESNLTVCGLDECIALIHTFADHPEKLLIEALEDGDIIQANEPVLKITGHYESFGFLESMIDGILSRRTSVSTNAKDVLQAAQGKPVFSMADRQDDYLTQTGDGYASYIAGITRIATDAQGLWWGGQGMGTMPHALIQVCGGDILKAVELYQRQYPNEPITALIDYRNRVVEDSLMLAKALQGKLNAVRVDTSVALIDEYLVSKGLTGDEYRGVNPTLIKALRKELDEAGHPQVKIIVSSGFNPEKILRFEQAKTPVDLYGVGQYLVKIRTNFTGDLVMLNGQTQAKVGRAPMSGKRLKKVPFPIV